MAIGANASRSFLRRELLRRFGEQSGVLPKEPRVVSPPVVRRQSVRDFGGHGHPREDLTLLSEAQSLWAFLENIFVVSGEVEEELPNIIDELVDV